MRSPLRGYFKETRKPIYSAALVFPLFLAYHAGTFALRTTYINGADALIIRLLHLASVDTMFASAIVLLVVFLAWQLRTRGSWTVDTVKLLCLYVESVGLAGLLFLFFGWLSTHVELAAGKPARPGRLASLVLFCGAGIYEELVFRGFLLGGLLWLFARPLGLRKKAAAFWATVTGALIFALFHYLGPAGDAFTIRSFLNRTLAGVYFSVLFVTRGFGVTAATHAFYDMLVALVFF